MCCVSLQFPVFKLTYFGVDFLMLFTVEQILLNRFLIVNAIGRNNSLLCM